jgi:two-component system, LytTR family, sensor kinase
MISKELKFISELSCYKPRSILFRIGAVSAVALAFMLVSTFLFIETLGQIPIGQYIRVVIVFNILTEANVLLDNFSERFFPIPSKIKIRVLLHFILSLTIGFLSIFYFERQLHSFELLQQPFTWLMFAFGLIFVFILIVISISLRIVTQWLASQREVEELRRLQMKNDYNALQDQLNPHFLFNNLSVLKSMIQYDPNAALAFTQNFTDTYRYVLQNRDRTTVLLSEEIDFIHAYLDLHRERLGDALHVEMNVEARFLSRRIPPLSLQLLVENAIKHNIVSKNQILTIRIYSQNEWIVVENNLQPKDSSYSTSKGLKNLSARYELLTEQKVRIIQNELIFKVELPIL